MTSNSSSSAAVRFVIVGFDGLRPDSVEADMPALSRFMASNHSWSHYLADFPTETYVNHPGIFSGFRPTGHGLVANCYWRRDMGGADGVFFGFDLEHVLRHRREDGLLLVPTMGERLGAAGKTMRVYCANSKGSTRLQHLYATSAASSSKISARAFRLNFPTSGARSSSSTSSSSASSRGASAT